LTVRYMRHSSTLILILCCFSTLFLICYAPAIFMDRQFGYRDAANYYYSLNNRVQAEWNAGRWPLWEPEENAGMPLLGNPTAAVLYPGKLIFAVLPYPWAARTYVLSHSVLAFLAMLALMRSWGTSWFGSALSALSYAFGTPVLFQYCNVIYLIGAAWLPLGIHAVDGWIRLGQRWCVLELAIVMSMQVLGGDPQTAYLVGLTGLGYASYLASNRARSNKESLAREKPSDSRRGLSLLLWAIALLGLGVLTVALALWLPKLRDPGNPPPPLRWMLWVPLAVSMAWLSIVVGFLIHWRRRGWLFPLGTAYLGLAGAAVLAGAICAAQLLPVIEFTRQTGRSNTSPHETYLYTVEPFRLIELAWPNILGMPLESKSHWGAAIKMPGGHSKGWVPSHYLGGLTLGLALGALAIRSAPPWRVWLTVVGGLSLLGSLGQYTSPVWTARAMNASSNSATLHNWLADLGPMDPSGPTIIRPDGYLRDCDGGFYWWLAIILPGFRQFRYPAKLFTLTVMAITAVAGSSWDRVCAGRGRGTLMVLRILLALTVAALAAVVFQKETILASLHALKSRSSFGSFDAASGYGAITDSLGQAAIVLGAGVVLTTLARRRPWLASAAALILTTADLAAANSRYILTVPQSLFEAKPEVLTAIEDAERIDPSPGPFRIHRMSGWYPSDWAKTSSTDRINEHVAWERNTLHPKYGIDYGLEYTHTIGVAQLHEYDQIFTSFYSRIRDRYLEKFAGVTPAGVVIYHPRRAYDMWNTRYFIVPFDGNGQRDPVRGYASFLFQSKQVYPNHLPTNASEADEQARNWAGARDFKVIRNLVAYPRSWIVHQARATSGSAEPAWWSENELVKEMLYAADPIWNEVNRHAYDPRELAWIGDDDLAKISSYISAQPTKPSEAVKVTYPNPQQAVLEARLDSPGLVILADSYYPGWELTIDDKPAPIYRVNGAMRGAAVLSGAHRLVYTYSPRSFRAGCFLSIAGLIAMLILSLACAKWPVESVLAAKP
jgi:Bacterial membrane protein YfhO